MILVLLTLTSYVAYYYNTPKVYATIQHKGMLDTSTEIYNMVIPKTALINEDSVYFAYSYETAASTKYRAVLKNVTIMAEDEHRCAISPEDSISEDWLIIIEHEDNIKNHGDVIVLES